MRGAASSLVLLVAAAVVVVAVTAAGEEPAKFHIERPDADALPDQPTGMVVDHQAAAGEELGKELAGVNKDRNLDEEILADNAALRDKHGRRDTAARRDAAANDDVTAAVDEQRAADKERESEKEKRGTLPAAAPMYDAARGPAMELSCRECKEWFEREADPAGWVTLLPDCPCTRAEARAAQGKWHPMPHSTDMERYFPGAFDCVLSAPVHSHGQQCCYTSMGHLITSGFGAGTPHEFAHPTVMPTASAMHFLRDVVPFQQCCEQCVSPGCHECRSTYFAKRPSNRGSGCPATPSPASVPFCEPREHVCFQHEGKLFVKSSGVCVDASLGGGGGGGGGGEGGGGGGGGKCAPHPNTPCAHDCVAAESDQVRLGCFCAREVSGSDVICTETVPLLRAVE